jgi:hypothetical protein
LDAAGPEQTCMSLKGSDVWLAFGRNNLRARLTPPPKKTPVPHSSGRTSQDRDGPFSRKHPSASETPKQNCNSSRESSQSLSQGANRAGQKRVLVSPYGLERRMPTPAGPSSGREPHDRSLCPSLPTMEQDVPGRGDSGFHQTARLLPAGVSSRIAAREAPLSPACGTPEDVTPHLKKTAGRKATHQTRAGHSANMRGRTLSTTGILLNYSSVSSCPYHYFRAIPGSHAPTLSVGSRSTRTEPSRLAYTTSGGGERAHAWLATQATRQVPRRSHGIARSCRPVRCLTRLDAGDLHTSLAERAHMRVCRLRSRAAWQQRTIVSRSQHAGSGEPVTVHTPAEHLAGCEGVRYMFSACASAPGRADWPTNVPDPGP